MFLNTSEVVKDESKKDFELIPKGWYRVIVSESTGKHTKDGKGYYLALTFTVIGKEFNGRKIWCNYNVKNQNEQAVKIALQELKALCVATNNDRPFEQEFEFHAAITNKTLMVKVGHRTDKRDDSTRVTILDYKNDNEQYVADAVLSPTNMDIPF